MATAATLEELFPLDFRPTVRPLSTFDWCYQVNQKHYNKVGKTVIDQFAPGMVHIKNALVDAYRKQSRYFDKRSKWAVMVKTSKEYDDIFKYLMTESWETIFTNPFPLSGNALSYFTDENLETLMISYFTQHIQKLPPNTIHPFYSGLFGNFYTSPFVADGITFATSEKLFMMYKAMHFEDEITAEKIMNADHPAAAKAWGRAVSNFDEVEWDRVSYAYMCRALYCKFTGVEKLYWKLQDTDNMIMIEASETDDIWGSRINLTNGLNLIPKFLPGLDLLGRGLMDVRQVIKDSTDQ